MGSSKSQGCFSEPSRDLGREAGKNDTMPLAQKNAVITGGASGMGEAIAHRLALDGVGVALWDINEEGARSVAASIVAAGGRAVAQRVDIIDRAAVREAAAAAAEALGPIHILVNSAGLGVHLPIEDHTEEVFDRIIDLNLKGVFNTIHALLPGMEACGWGRIVNIASLAGQAGVARMTGYSAAKAGVIGLTKAVAREVGGSGITCNVISPGAIDTPMLRNSIARGAIAATRTEARIDSLMGRVGTVDEIAGAALYFISEPAAYVTGQLIGVNGGEFM
jgi:2-hydroxycyclohexanecarboxyl-CoA dehydrogenase